MVIVIFSKPWWAILFWLWSNEPNTYKIIVLIFRLLVYPLSHRRKLGHCMVWVMAGVKLQRSLNAEAPEFFPSSRNNQVDEVSYFASYLQTPQIFSFQNPYLLYHRPSTSYLNTHLSRNKTGFGDLPHAPADVATSSESVPFWVNTPDEETYLTVDEAAEEPQLGVQNGSNYHRKAKRGPYGNRFLWRRRYKQEWRLRRQNGEEGGCSRYGDGENFSRYPRNLHYRAAPPKIKHPVLPLESDGLNTTVMIRNIPNKFTYIWSFLLLTPCGFFSSCFLPFTSLFCAFAFFFSREMLMNFLDDHCKVENEKAQVQNSVAKDEEPALVSTFDFLYLPIDFQ